MKLCCFRAVETGYHMAIDPKIVARIYEVEGGQFCLIYTNDDRQPLKVHGNFESVVTAVAEASQEEKEK